MKQSADALLSVLNDILDFSKIEAGKLELEQTPFDLAEAIGDATQVLALAAANKGIELVCRTAPDLPARVLGDSGRLRQILVNLVGNAVKFTEHGEVFVDAFWESPADARARLHCLVRDSGIGIPPEKQQMIFEAFAQAERETTRRFGGTGLGLAISSQLVKIMGGTIWVDSRPDEGSSFHFRLPLEPDEASGAGGTVRFPRAPRLAGCGQRHEQENRLGNAGQPGSVRRIGGGYSTRLDRPQTGRS